MATKRLAKKTTTNKNSVLQRPVTRKLIIITATVLVVLFAVYVVRAWLRITVVPGVVSTFQLSSVEETANDELTKLSKPFTALGFGNPETTMKDCSMSLAQKFSEVVSCTYTLHAYGPVATDDAGKQALNARVVELQKQLQANSWQGYYGKGEGTTSLETLVENLTQGIDYTPDATYAKKIGNVDCRFSSTTAFSKPSPVAINIEFSCTKTISIFGGVNPPEFMPSGADGPTLIVPEGLPVEQEGR